MRPQPFEQPVYVTRPLLPNLASFAETLEDVWSRQWLTNDGHYVRRFEAALQAYLGARHLSTITNGTLALMLGLRSMGLAGEVITTPLTFPATLHALSWLGLEPVFADIDPGTLTLDPAAVASALTPRTCAIVGVHCYGVPCDVVGFERLSRLNGIPVVYDGAHAFGTCVNGRPIASFGAATMFSFHATKLFHTAEGGAIATDDQALDRQIRLQRNFGIEDEATVSTDGINAKMSELQAALGLHVLDLVESEKTKRGRIRQIYRDRFQAVPGLELLELPNNATDSRQYCIALINEGQAGKNRDYVVERLKDWNIFARRYFHPLCSDMPHYRHLSSTAKDCLSNARKAANEVISLPYYGRLEDEDVHRICDVLIHILEDAG